MQQAGGWGWELIIVSTRELNDWLSRTSCHQKVWQQYEGKDKHRARFDQPRRFFQFQIWHLQHQKRHSINAIHPEFSFFAPPFLCVVHIGNSPRDHPRLRSANYYAGYVDADVLIWYIYNKRRGAGVFLYEKKNDKFFCDTTTLVC